MDQPIIETQGIAEISLSHRRATEVGPRTTLGSGIQSCRTQESHQRQTIAWASSRVPEALQPTPTASFQHQDTDHEHDEDCASGGVRGQCHLPFGLRILVPLGATPGHRARTIRLHPSQKHFRDLGENIAGPTSVIHKPDTTILTHRSPTLQNTQPAKNN